MPVRREKKWNQASAALTRRAQDLVAQAGIMLQTKIKTGFTHASNRTNGGIASAVGSPPGVKTGTLRRSIQIDQANLRNTIRPSVRVGTNLIYARIQEYGGVITAKKGYLTIPLNAKAQGLRARHASLRALKLITIRSRKGNLLLCEPAGKRKPLKPMFVLKKSVRLPARPYMRPAARRARPKIIALFKAGGLIGAKVGGVAR